MATKETAKPKEELGTAKTTDNPPKTPIHGMNIIGEEVKGKNETRLFQTAPDTKEWLTKEQAKGFYWKEEKKS